MFDAKTLWAERAGGRIRDFGKYLRYIFNGHLVIVLLFLIGSAAYYYQKWITTLKPEFPAFLITAIILSVFLTRSPVYNFLLEADRVFLLPLETRLKGYFLRSGLVSLIFQGYIILMVFAVLMPMYAKVSGRGFKMFLSFLIVLLAVKGWNLAVSWRIQYFVQAAVHNWDMAVRYFLNAVFTYLLLKEANFFLLLALILVMVFYYWSFYVRTKLMGLKWDLLISSEEKRVASFYRLANMFTDVPTLKDVVKRRKWLDLWISKIPYRQDQSYLYLFARTFLRAGDYLGLFIRLTVIGIVAIYFLSFGMGQVLLSILFLYLTGFQLLPLWKHHQYKIWVDLYPVSEKYKQKSFYFLIQMILSIEIVFFAVFILIKGQESVALIDLLSGILFNLVFVHFYIQKRLEV
ncbi:ABC transporter permease [Bacillus sp. BRMEA1]|uniref:ABC transporter permease n=1 Tax=Neobacillus endophyticus TaxID=2738405 RepID=UPI0015648190|nr:ABC transporter permease [Neobacillus endophyticus]NRD78367.1 ABC transporter permease [Neobacillus endophyticus]